MKVYLINLDRDKERMAAADAQLVNLGVSYERISAIYGKSLPQASIINAVDRFRWWCAIGRPVRLGEIGCAMSHYSIYRRITEPACILEDDVILSNDFPSVLQRVEKFVNPSSSQVVLLSNHTKLKCKGANIVRSVSDMYTEGYVITPPAARALLKANWPLQRPCDHWGAWVGRGIIELYHAFPTVCSQNQMQYESSVSSGCEFNVRNLKIIQFIVHKCARIIGKVLDRILPI